MLYSSLDAVPSNTNDPPADANSYRPFKFVNTVITNNIQKELDLLEGLTEERAFMTASSSFLFVLSIDSPVAPVTLVGALTKALCCKLLSFSACVSSQWIRYQPFGPSTGWKRGH